MYCHPESILAVRSSLSLWGFHGKFAPHLLSCTVPKNMLLTMSHTQINRCWELYRLSRVPFRLWHFPWNLQNATLYNFRESFVEIHKQVIVLLILCMRRIEEFSATVISHVKYFPPSFKSFSGHAVKWHSALKFHNSFQLKGKKNYPVRPFRLQILCEPQKNSWKRSWSLPFCHEVFRISVPFPDCDWSHL